jgi:hypothetical protein
MAQNNNQSTSSQQKQSMRQREEMTQTKKRKELPSWWISALFICFVYEWLIAMFYCTGMFARLPKADAMDTFLAYSGGMVGLFGVMLLLVTLHWFHNE